MDLLTRAQPPPRLLQQVELFRDLAESDLLQVIARLRFRHEPRGAVIYREGDPSEALFIIETGQVKITGGFGPRSVIIETLGPDMPFGDMSLLTGEPRTTTATVSIDAELWALSKQDFDELLVSYPAIALNLSRMLARRLQLSDQQRVTGVAQDLKRLIGVVGTPEEILLLARSAARQSGRRLLLLDVIDTGDENSTVDPGDPFADVVSVAEGVDRLEVQVELSSGDFSEVVSHLLRRYDQLLVRLPDQNTPQVRQALELAEAVVRFGRQPGHWLHREGLPASMVWSTGVAGEPGYDQGRIDRDRDRLARRLTGRRVGVALSSGGAHGLAHIGLLMVLDKAGIPVDLVAGTSMGSMIGSAYAAGHRGRALFEIGRQAAGFLNLRTGWRVADFQLSRSGFIRGSRFEQAVGRWMGQRSFEELEIPFFTVAAEVIGGRAVVFSSGPVAHGVRASCSLPGIMAAVPHGDDFLIDGAAVDPVPCRVLADAGADIIIACNVIPQVADRLYRRVNQRPGKPPSFLDVVHSESEIMAAQVAVLKMQPVDVLVTPHVGQYHWRDGQRIAEFARLGAEATQAVLPEITALLKPGARRFRPAQP